MQRLHEQSKPAARDVQMWRLKSTNSASGSPASTSAGRRHGKSAPDPYLAMAQDVNNVEGRRQASARPGPIVFLKLFTWTRFFVNFKIDWDTFFTILDS